VTINATRDGYIPLAGNKQQQTTCCRWRALQTKITKTNFIAFYRNRESPQFCAHTLGLFK